MNITNNFTFTITHSKRNVLKIDHPIQVYCIYYKVVDILLSLQSKSK